MLAQPVKCDPEPKCQCDQLTSSAHSRCGSEATFASFFAGKALDETVGNKGIKCVPESAISDGLISKRVASYRAITKG